MRVTFWKDILGVRATIDDKPLIGHSALHECTHNAMRRFKDRYSKCFKIEAREDKAMQMLLKKCGLDYSRTMDHPIICLPVKSEEEPHLFLKVVESSTTSIITALSRQIVMIPSPIEPLPYVASMGPTIHVHIDK
ncbi:hypothetical protein FOL47_006294 [Perkinsus chesapeaki]|uniref:Uncharacterized protein n=1 Tax=Perkinsus chesapeaki TaxID=330153 RepID=A0A7J6MYV9_PERCH|nr:hypothetical protein FOL47_006294 [Perkinsus chesapeaki]